MAAASGMRIQLVQYFGGQLIRRLLFLKLDYHLFQQEADPMHQPHLMMRLCVVPLIAIYGTNPEETFYFSMEEVLQRSEDVGCHGEVFPSLRYTMSTQGIRGG